jgi:transposase-like protein
MYSFGMSDRNIQKHLEQVYNVEVPPDLISRVTNEVIEEVREWQNRPLERCYAMRTKVRVYLDALRVKSREDGKSCNKSVRTKVRRGIRGEF